MSHLINIFLEPGKVFAELKERPTFLVPILLTIVLTVVMTLMYFGKVDSDWFIDHSMAASGREMSAQDIANAKKMMPSAKVQGYFGAVIGPVFIVIVYLLMGLYYWLAGKITGTATSFKHGLSLTAWSSVPTLLGMVVTIIGVVMMTPQTALNSLMLTNLDPLLVQLPLDHAWSSFAKNFNLLTFWSIFLAAVGWRTWGRTSWTQAITVALIPSLLIYGGMAVFALMKS
jgi:hypothetical protein